VDGAAYTAHGYAFVNISYRGLSRYKMPALIEDTKCAIRYLRARAASYNINPERIGLIGPSAGGYLVAMDGLTDASAGFEGRGGFEGVSSRVQAVVALYPFVSFELPPFSAADAQARAVLPVDPSPEVLHALSLPTYVSKNAPPFLFFVGEFDDQLSPGASLDLHNRLHTAGVDSTFVLVKGVGHGWDTPRLPKAPYGPVPTDEEITRAEIDFFDRHLKK
jgi:acetyl esterase/lipase